MWQEVTKALISEFADLPDFSETARVLTRLLMAALFGGVLGYEREHRGKAAGLRTHMLVAMGAALFVLVPERVGMQSADISRVIQGIVAGVGFLGAGAIVKRHAAEDVEGLTTAAGIWLTAAIGITCGLGKAGTALLVTMFAWLILALIPHLSRPPR